MATLHLTRVASVEDIRDAVRAFNGSSFEPELARELLRETTYWVSDSESGDFGPSKFCGFKRFNSRTYLRARKGQYEGVAFDGGIARVAIETSTRLRFETRSQTKKAFVEWATRVYGTDTFVGIDQAKWRFLTLPAEAQNVSKYWAMFANPGIYRVDDAVHERAEDSWVTTDQPIRKGDRLLIWRGQGCRGTRGIVALAEVLTNPKEFSDHENPYWIKPPAAAAIEPRVRVRYVLPQNLPLGFDDNKSLLSGLSVAKARGGTVFKIAPEQWSEVLSAAGGWPSSSTAGSSSESQGKAPNRQANEEYLARLCWNSGSWTQPTGEAAEAEHDTYASETGFGHEEWLFNFEWVLDGWKYGFLQPVNRSHARMKGRAIAMRMYTISAHGEWFYVGRISQCEVLTEEQAEAVRSEFRARRWLKEMESHVKRVGGDVNGLRYEEPQTVFNVRFRPESLELHDPMVPVGVSDGIRKFRRYTLVKLEGSRTKVLSEWPGRTGKTESKSTDTKTRKATPATTCSSVEAQLQNELCALLKKSYGADSVGMEENFVDVKLVHENAVHLFEVKSDPRPRKAIRDALGQLLEYAFRCERNGDTVGSLNVAAPNELIGLDREYLEHLRKERGLPLHYLCLRRGMKSLQLPW